MIIQAIIEALSNPTHKYEGTDRVPGTDVVRTYVTGAWLYSRESDMEVMLANRHTPNKNNR